MNEWQELPLERVANIHDNLREPVNSTERSKRVGPYPYYGATGQVGWIDGYRQDGEYVLLGEDGAPFLDPTKTKAYLVSGKCWVNNHAHVLRGKEGTCINKFLLHALNAVDYRGYANGTTRLKLTQAAMKRLPIKLPGVEQQKEVVSKIEELFSDLDAGVAGLERTLVKLKRYRASVLKAAVEGRLTAAWRAEQKAKGVAIEPAAKLLERILAERRKKWEAAQLKKFTAAGKQPPKGWQGKYIDPTAPDTSTLPELTEGWRWTSFEQIAEIQSGLQKQPSRAPRDNAYPYLRVANVLRGRLDLSEVHQFELFPGEIDKLRLENGDLLIVEGNGSPSEIGRCAIWTGEIENCIHQNHIIRVRPLLVSPAFMSIYWNSPDGTKRVKAKAASTSGLYTLSVSKVAALPVPLPSFAEQTEIVSQVDSALTSITHAEAEIKTALARAARLRQAILKRAFEGRLV